MSKNDEKIKILMLKGEKGDTYDDTELRTEIDTKLANTPYIKYQEDDDYELPIHSINDNEVNNVKTWSSEKITNEYQQVCYFNPNSLNNTIECDKTFEELIALEKAIINIQYFNEIITAKYHHLVRDLSMNIISVIIEGELINGRVRITHNSNNTITYQELESLDDEISNLQSDLNKRKQVIYTLSSIGSTTATCNLTYDEIKSLITNNINYSVSVKLGTSYYTAYEVINGGNIGVMVNIPEEDKKVMVSHNSSNTITVASGTSDIANINNKVNPLWSMRWIDGGNVTDTDGIFVPWSNGSASTVLILCMNNSDNRVCQVFLGRKTMTSGQRAIRLCGASDTLGVYASISQSQGVLIALADDITPYPTGAQIYYQYIDL